VPALPKASAPTLPTSSAPALPTQSVAEQDNAPED
jgi:hypothetical protein